MHRRGIGDPDPEHPEVDGSEAGVGHRNAARAGDQGAVGEWHRQCTERVAFRSWRHRRREAGVKPPPPIGRLLGARDGVDELADRRSCRTQHGRLRAAPAGRKHAGHDPGERLDQRVRHDDRVARSLPDVWIDRQWQPRRPLELGPHSCVHRRIDLTVRESRRHQRKKARIGRQFADQLGGRRTDLGRHQVSERACGHPPPRRVERVRRDHHDRQGQRIVGRRRRSHHPRHARRHRHQPPIAVDRQRQSDRPTVVGAFLDRQVDEQLRGDRALATPDRPPGLDGVIREQDLTVGVATGEDSLDAVAPHDDLGEAWQRQQDRRIEFGELTVERIEGDLVPHRQHHRGRHALRRRT